jgi:type IV secretion system protein VirB10
MKHVNQTRALFLSCCLLVFARWSAAQSGLLTDTNRTTEPRPEVITIPAGTHLLMKLISPLHTTSSTPGSGVYLETALPVVENNRVVIPEHTRVMGVVTDERRPGRVQGRAQMRLRFTQLILPDNRELSVVGSLQSLPGSSTNRTVNHEGTLEPVDQIDADVYTVAKTTGAGVLVGSIRHVGIGVGQGALIGAGLGLAKVLFTRGDEISLPVGTRVEMVLQRPLTVQPTPSAKLTDSGDTPNHKPEPAW